MNHADDDALLSAIKDQPDVFQPSPTGDALRERIFLATAKRLVARRRLRRMAIATTFTACFVAGVAVAPWLRPDAPKPATSPAAAIVPRVDAGNSITAEAPPVRPSPAQIEERARTAPADQRLLLFKLAGDRFLNDDVDVVSALRCYRAMLDSASPTDRKRFDPTDSWLLTSLKQSNP